MGRLLQVLGGLFVAFVAFVGLLHGVLMARGKHTPEVLNAFHEWPVVGGFFPRHASPAVEPSPEERREKDAVAWLQDSRNEFKLPPGVTMEQIESLVRELKDARARAEAARTRYEAEQADLDRMRREAEADRQSLRATADEIVKQVNGLKAERDELTRERTFVKEEESKNVRTLASMYEAMPPDDAARKLQVLDEETAAKLIGMMSERKAGRILAAIDTPRAVAVTKRLQALAADKSSKPQSEPASSR